MIFPTQTKIKIEPKCIAGGGKHTVILTTKNELLTCGDNDKGQLGKELSILVQHSFRTVCSPYKIIKVACGWDFNLGLTENMEVVGWGSNSFGQLGLPINEISHLSVPRKIFECKALEIAAGLRHSVIITLKGSVFTAGYNKKGQLGVCLSGEIPLQLDKFVQGMLFNLYEHKYT